MIIMCFQHDDLTKKTSSKLQLSDKDHKSVKEIITSFISENDSYLNYDELQISNTKKLDEVKTEFSYSYRLDS